MRRAPATQAATSNASPTHGLNTRSLRVVATAVTMLSKFFHIGVIPRAWASAGVAAWSSSQNAIAIKCLPIDRNALPTLLSATASGARVGSGPHPRS